MKDSGRRKRFTGAARVLTILALLAAVCALMLRFVSGMRFLSTLALGGAVGLFLLALLERWSRESAAARWARNALLAAFALGLLLFTVSEGLVLAGAKADADDARVQAIIVLGAGVNGETPSLTLRTRLDAAEVYIRAHPDLPVILSGGQGEGEDITEAECMRRALTARGIDEDRLYLEEQSTSTAENLACSLELLETLGFVPWSGDTPDGGRVAVVTNGFHLYRTRLLGAPSLRVVGVPATLPWLHLNVNYYVREAFAVAEIVLLGGQT